MARGRTIPLFSCVCLSVAKRTKEVGTYSMVSVDDVSYFLLFVSLRYLDSMCSLKGFVREKLIEAGWNDSVKGFCLEKVKSLGVESTTVSALVEEVAPAAKGTCPFCKLPVLGPLSS